MLAQNKGQLTGVSTGFTRLDEMTAGLQKGDLIVIAGRPSMGKTTFALNIAEYEGNRNALVRVPCEDLSLPMLPVRTLWLQGARLSETERWIQQRMGQLLRAGAQA